MGQKVNPHGLRVGVIQDWDSRWFAGKKDFGNTLVEDYKLRSELKKVVWPTPQQVLKNTAIVACCVVAVGVFIWLFDFVAQVGIDALIGLFH